MFGLVPLVEGLVGTKFAKPLIYGVGALLLVLAVWGGIKLYDHHVIAAHDAQTVQRAAPATDQAATERANDAIANNQTEQEMHNVVAAQPDQPIAPSSHARGCDQLRRAHRSVAACR